MFYKSTRGGCGTDKYGKKGKEVSQRKPLSRSEQERLHWMALIRVIIERRGILIRLTKPNPILQEVLKSEESGSPLLGYNGANREQLIANQLWAREQVASLLGMVDILRITRQAFIDETLDAAWHQEPDFLEAIDPDAYLEMIETMSRAQKQQSS